MAFSQLIPISPKFILFFLLNFVPEFGLLTGLKKTRESGEKGECDA
jgi:hypothetical protein